MHKDMSGLHVGKQYGSIELALKKLSQCQSRVEAAAWSDECRLIYPAVTLKGELAHSELCTVTTWMLLAWQLAWVSMHNTVVEY